MKYSYELSELAKLDLEDIWIYKVKRWSLNQANEYYELIIDEIIEFCKNPQLGKSIERIKKLHRLRKIKSHLIIYKNDNKTVYVDRMLHKKMDINSRLNE